VLGYEIMVAYLIVGKICSSDLPAAKITQIKQFTLAALLKAKVMEKTVVQAA
jgi:hypothetical protein